MTRTQHSEGVERGSASIRHSSLATGHLSLGIRVNLWQFVLQLVQVFFVGLTLGMTRTVVPAVAESEFNLPQGAMGLLVTFVIAFGIVKAVMNFVAGAISERLGRKRVLVIGWLVALPIPVLIWYGPSWNWIVAATVLLGVNQGLTWSMALTSKLDLTRADQRGLTNGLNEFFGYFAVAVAGIATGYMSAQFGARTGLLIFGLATIIPALAIALLLVRDTRPWTIETSKPPNLEASKQESLSTVTAANVDVSTFRRFDILRLTIRDRRFFALCQAGLIEKFIDALVWLFFPLYLVSRGVDLKHIGWVPGVYASVWGVSQLLTGPLSDRIGRKPPIVAGMFMCALGAALLVVRDSPMWWVICAAITGFGMALLYPNLGAAIADLAQPSWRGTALGAYRFWRDLGYAVGALILGLVTHVLGQLEVGFWIVSVSLAASGALFWAMGDETHPKPRLG